MWVVGLVVGNVMEYRGALMEVADWVFMGVVVGLVGWIVVGGLEGGIVVVVRCWRWVRVAGWVRVVGWIWLGEGKGRSWWW